jgi:hypothetical protein
MYSVLQQENKAFEVGLKLKDWTASRCEYFLIGLNYSSQRITSFSAPNIKKCTSSGIELSVRTSSNAKNIITLMGISYGVVFHISIGGVEMDDGISHHSSNGLVIS